MDFLMKKAKIKDLIPADYNPRLDLQPGDPDFEKLRRSIKEFGYVEPIIVNKRTKLIVGGHQRAKVLEDEGYDEVTYLEIDVDPEKEKALNLALNKISGDWDMPKLKDLLFDIDTGDFDIELTGFDIDEIEDLMTQTYQDDDEREAVDDDFDPDEALDEIDEPVSKLGDIWQLGDHRLMCGDSTNPEHVKQLMNGAKADMVFTDPPWNVNYGAVKDGNAQGYKPRTIQNDHMSTDDFKTFMDKAFDNMKLASKDGCMVYVVMSAQEWGNLMLSLFENGFHWSSTIIWNKDRLVLSRKDYHTKYEPIWYGWKAGSPRIAPLEDRKQSDVWDFDRPTTSEEHPTMKPIPLVAKAITNSSRKGSNVLDLFGGSGTTLMAAEQTGRVAQMMELDPKYADVIVNRYEKYTGRKAVRINEAEQTHQGNTG